MWYGQLIIFMTFLASYTLSIRSTITCTTCLSLKQCIHRPICHIFTHKAFFSRRNIVNNHRQLVSQPETKHIPISRYPIGKYLVRFQVIPIAGQCYVQKTSENGQSDRAWRKTPWSNISVQYREQANNGDYWSGNAWGIHHYLDEIMWGRSQLQQTLVYNLAPPKSGARGSCPLAPSLRNWPYPKPKPSSLHFSGACIWPKQVYISPTTIQSKMVKDSRYLYPWYLLISISLYLLIWQC